MRGYSPLLTVGYKYNSQKVIYLNTTEEEGAKNVVFLIYIITLTSLIIFPFGVLIIRGLCLISLDMLMKYTLTKIQKLRFNLGKVLGYSVW